MKLSFQTKLLLSYFLLLMAMGVTLLVLLNRQLDRELVNTVRDNLGNEARLAKIMVERSTANLELDAPNIANNISRQINVRVTIIAPNGNVVGDSEVAADRLASLENHADRPEVAEALAGKLGNSIRMSSTRQNRMLYLALPFGNANSAKGVIRLALPLVKVEAAKKHMHQIVAIASCTAFAIAVLLSIIFTRITSRPLRDMANIARHIAAGDYGQRLRYTGHDEIGQLAQAMNHMAEQVGDQVTELHRLEQIRSDFVANVSHELRTPITVIKGYAETLRAGIIEDDPRQAICFMEKIEKNANRLSQLVKDLLALSELESTGFRFEVEAIALPLVARQVCDLLEQKAIERRVIIKNNLSKNLPLVAANRQRIEQVLFNLLDNAITYTPSGGAITVSAEPDAGKVTVKISDTGIGIPPHHLPRIFERFYRVDPGRSRDEGGTGLGLAIVKHIVHLHGGNVSAFSEQGLGSTFCFTLPLA